MISSSNLVCFILLNVADIQEYTSLSQRTCKSLNWFLKIFNSSKSNWLAKSTKSTFPVL